MNYNPKFERRSFLIGSAATVGGLSVGFRIPFGDEAAAEEALPEVNAWVVIRPTKPSSFGSRDRRWARER